MSVLTKTEMNDIKRTVKIVAVSYFVVHVFADAFTAMRRHPLIVALAVACWIGYHAIVVGFGYDVINIEALRNVTESSYSATHGADECSRATGFTVCSYNDDSTATFGVDDRIQEIVIPAHNMTHDYALTPKYFKYVLYRMGISEYYEPSSADENGIVWHNIPHIREAVLRTDSNMNATNLTVDFK